MVQQLPPDFLEHPEGDPAPPANITPRIGWDTNAAILLTPPGSAQQITGVWFDDDATPGNPIVNEIKVYDENNIEVTNAVVDDPTLTTGAFTARFFAAALLLQHDLGILRAEVTDGDGETNESTPGSLVTVSYGYKDPCYRASGHPRQNVADSEWLSMGALLAVDDAAAGPLMSGSHAFGVVTQLKSEYIVLEMIGNVNDPTKKPGFYDMHFQIQIPSEHRIIEFIVAIDGVDQTPGEFTGAFVKADIDLAFQDATNITVADIEVQDGKSTTLRFKETILTPPAGPETDLTPSVWTHTKVEFLGAGSGPPNNPPVLNIPGIIAGTEATQIRQAFTVSDADLDVLTVTSDIGAVIANGGDDYEWRYTPEAIDDGITVTFTANDGTEDSVGTSTLNITAINHLPVITAPIGASTTENVEITVLFTATDQDGDSLTVTSLDGVTPIGTVNDLGSGAYSWVYTPILSEHNTTITLDADDGTGSTTHDFVLSVIASAATKPDATIVAPSSGNNPGAIPVETAAVAVAFDTTITTHTFEIRGTTNQTLTADADLVALGYPPYPPYLNLEAWQGETVTLGYKVQDSLGTWSDEFTTTVAVPTYTRTVTVKPGGGGSHTSLTDALADKQDGDLILIDAGTYQLTVGSESGSTVFFDFGGDSNWTVRPASGAVIIRGTWNGLTGGPDVPGNARGGQSALFAVSGSTNGLFDGDITFEMAKDRLCQFDSNATGLVIRDCKIGRSLHLGFYCLSGDPTFINVTAANGVESHFEFPTNPAFTWFNVTNITKANPAVVTTNVEDGLPFPYKDGWWVHFQNMTGMTELQNKIALIDNVNTSAGTFELVEHDSTSYGTFTGGEQRVILPTSKDSGTAFYANGNASPVTQDPTGITVSGDPTYWGCTSNNGGKNGFASFFNHGKYINCTANNNYHQGIRGHILLSCEVIGGTFSGNKATAVQIETGFKDSHPPSVINKDVLIDGITADDNSSGPGEANVWVQNAEDVVVQRCTLTSSNVPIRINGHPDDALNVRGSKRVIVRENICRDHNGVATGQILMLDFRTVANAAAYHNSFRNVGRSGGANKGGFLIDKDNWANSANTDVTLVNNIIDELPFSDTNTHIVELNEGGSEVKDFRQNIYHAPGVDYEVGQVEMDFAAYKAAVGGSFETGSTDGVDPLLNVTTLEPGVGSAALNGAVDLATIDGIASNVLTLDNADFFRVGDVVVEPVSGNRYTVVAGGVGGSTITVDDATGLSTTEKLNLYRPGGMPHIGGWQS